MPFPAFLTGPLTDAMAGKGVDDLVFTGPKGATLRVTDGKRGSSLAISVGANVRSVRTMLGHKSAAMTLDVYADLFPDDLDAVAVALDHAVSL